MRMNTDFSLCAKLLYQNSEMSTNTTECVWRRGISLMVDQTIHATWVRNIKIIINIMFLCAASSLESRLCWVVDILAIKSMRFYFVHSFFVDTNWPNSTSHSVSTNTEFVVIRLLFGWRIEHSCFQQRVLISVKPKHPHGTFNENRNCLDNVDDTLNHTLTQTHTNSHYQTVAHIMLRETRIERSANHKTQHTKLIARLLQTNNSAN